VVGEALYVVRGVPRNCEPAINIVRFSKIFDGFSQGVGNSTKAPLVLIFYQNIQLGSFKNQQIFVAKYFGVRVAKHLDHSAREVSFSIARFEMAKASAAVDKWCGV
tara:strand:+ start:352 stop:669 length:318 start_codon:yes stop_codon:yes gene_type:complete